MAKNIEMQVLNSDGNYEVLYPKSLSSLIIMNDDTTLEESFENLKTSVSNGKSEISSAITDMGVSTASNATFLTMSNNIKSISNDCTATANQILSNYTAYSGGKKIIGAMTNDGMSASYGFIEYSYIPTISEKEITLQPIEGASIEYGTQISYNSKTDIYTLSGTTGIVKIYESTINNLKNKYICHNNEYYYVKRTSYFVYDGDNGSSFGTLNVSYIEPTKELYKVYLSNSLPSYTTETSIGDYYRLNITIS